MSKKHMKKSLALSALMAFLITGSAYAAPVFGTPGLVLNASNPVIVDGNKDYIPVTGDAISGFGSVTVAGDLNAVSRDNNALTVKNPSVFQAVDGKAFVGAKNITLNAADSYVVQTVPGVTGGPFGTSTIVKVANGNAIQAYDSVTVEAKNNLNLTANNRIIRALDKAVVNLNATNVNMNAELVDDAAIKITDGAKLAINATEDVVLNVTGTGELFTGIKAEEAKVEVLGKNIDINVVNAEGEVRGVNAREGSVINLGKEGTESVRVVVEGQDGYGILAQDLHSKVIVAGQALEIAGSGEVAGILAQNRTENYSFMTDDADVDPTKLVASVVVGENTTTNIKIVGENGIGIGAMSDGIVDVKGDLFVTAENAVLARGNAIVNINEAGNKTVQLDGNIYFDYDDLTSGSGIDADVNVKLTNADSWLKGNIQADPDAPDAVTGMNLELSNEATWVTDAESFVNNLEVNDGKIVIEASERGLFARGSAPAITVDTLTGTGMEVELANGEAEAGTIVVENEVDPEMYVGVTTYGVSMNTKEANETGKYIVQAAGEGIVDQINAKDTFISGDVVFKADENGNLEVTETTLKGDLNVDGKVNASDVVVGGASITEKFEAAEQQVADKFAEVQEQLGQAEEYVAGKFDAVDEKFAEVDSTLENHEGRIETLEGTVEDHEGRIGSLETTVGALNGAVDQEVADRIAADAALKQEVTDAYKAADANLQSQINTNKIANDVQSKQISGLQSKDLAHEKAIADNKAAINAEAEAREAADEQLQANIDAEATAREAADKVLQDNIDKEVANREAAVKDLNNRIDKVDAKIDKVGAMAAAMASLKTMGYDPEAPTEIAVGVGQYRNETGLAIGAFHYPNKNFMLNFSLSTAGDEVMGGIGATWKIGRKR
ncbi:MAG: YadA-like family protein [Phascolarctobacterium sp.]|nr:YadA-like family protein [Phascolarctobacterium sp.]